MEPSLQHGVPVERDQPKPGSHPQASVAAPLPPLEDAQFVLPRVSWQLVTSCGCVFEPGLQQPTPVVIDHPNPGAQPHWSTPLELAGVTPPAELGAAQFRLPRVAWHMGSSECAVFEPSLQQPTPVVIDQPNPGGQPHASTPFIVQSVFPRVAWHPAISPGCVFEPGLQQPRPVVIDHPKPGAQPHASCCATTTPPKSPAEQAAPSSSTAPVRILTSQPLPRTPFPPPSPAPAPLQRTVSNKRLYIAAKDLPSGAGPPQGTPFHLTSTVPDASMISNSLRERLKSHFMHKTRYETVWTTPWRRSRCSFPQTTGTEKWYNIPMRIAQQIPRR